VGRKRKEGTVGERERFALEKGEKGWVRDASIL